MDKLNKGIFSKKDKISLGVIRKEFVDFFNTHGLNGILKYDTVEYKDDGKSLA